MIDPHSISLWHDTAGDDWAARPALDTHIEADVAIIGAGFTGLWTAYYLHGIDPTLRIVMVEAQFAGFGASGRNGGWLSALLPMGWSTMAATHGRAAAVAMQRTMHAAIDEVASVADREGIECGLAKGGTVTLARSSPQVARLQAEIAESRSWGFDETDLRWMDAAEATNHVAATRVRGAMFTPHCAAVHPARLVRGLARTVERQGTRIYESSPVLSFGDGVVRTAHGTVSAEMIVRATEAFTPRLPGLKRAIVPVYSLMLATEPMPDSFFDEVGMSTRPTFNDARRMVIYGQRTADNRLAFGGRGAPYHFGSRIDPSFDRHEGVHQSLHETLRDLFPPLGDAAITHRWGGPVGIPRDWYCSVGLDRDTGIAWAGGYVGDGLTTTNVAGRTLADLITGRDTALVTMPWVNHRSRSWEPEPLRWLGINAMVRLPVGADAYEDRTDRPERWRSKILDRFLGH